jgi:hypothetical protein
LALQVLVRGLLAKPRAEALVLDAVGGFDVLRMESVVEGCGVSEGDVEGVLRRVKIVRVFDFVGVDEAIAELQAALSGKRKRRRGRRRGGEVLDSEDEEDEKEVEGWVEMVLVDNLTSVVNPLLKSNYVQGQSNG